MLGTFLVTVTVGADLELPGWEAVRTMILEAGTKNACSTTLSHVESYQTQSDYLTQSIPVNFWYCNSTTV